MNSFPLNYSSIIKAFSIFTLLNISIGCGAVGSPMPPEDVGIATKVRKQQQDRARSERVAPEDGSQSVEEETVELPAFYPIGTR